jgi:hypothetical protein
MLWNYDYIVRYYIAISMDTPHLAAIWSEIGEELSGYHDDSYEYREV